MAFTFTALSSKSKINRIISKYKTGNSQIQNIDQKIRSGKLRKASNQAHKITKTESVIDSQKILSQELRGENSTDVSRSTVSLCLNTVNRNMWPVARIKVIFCFHIFVDL